MSSSLESKINAYEATIGVVGMGFTGLTLLDAFGQKGFSLVGYDRDAKRVQMLKNKEPFYNFTATGLLFQLIDQKKFEPSSDPDILSKADVIIISVSTGLDSHHNPDFSPIRSAFETVAAHLNKGQLIIVQSTVYPGATEDELLPLLQKTGLKVGQDFFLANVPEISDPGQLDHPFSAIPRIIGGVTPACQKLAELLYKKVGCAVFGCSKPRISEAAKILQNTYRLVNISLINEMKIMFDRMGIDVWEVIKAASTKPFGFTPFYPSPGVGGDCIPVVSVYLTWKAREADGPTSLIDLAETINYSIPYYVVEKVIEGLAHRKLSIEGAKILVLGVGYKKDVNDLRESASLKILSLLKQKKAEIFYHDPYIEELPPLAKYPDLKMKSSPLDQLHTYDAVVIATDHSTYDFAKIVKESRLVIDTRNVTADLPEAKNKVIKG